MFLRSFDKYQEYIDQSHEPKRERMGCGEG